MNKSCFLLFFFIASLFVFAADAQTHEIDSLRRQVRLASTTGEKLNWLLLLCEERNSLSSDSLYHYASDAKQLAASSHDNLRSLWADYYMISALEKKGLFDSDSTSRIIDQKLKETQSDDPSFTALHRKFIYIKAAGLLRKNQYKQAMSIFFDLLKQADQSADTFNQIAGKSGIGWTYMEMNQPREALDWFYKTLETTSDPVYERYRIATYINMAAVFGQMNRMDSVERYADMAIAKAREKQMLTYLSNALNLKASLYMTTDRNKLAEQPLQEALAIRKQIGDPFYTVADLAQLAGYYTNQGKPEKALPLCREGLDICQKYGLTGKLPMMYYALATVYKVKGDLKAYSSSMERYVAVKDSLYQANTAGAIAELEAKYELQKKENTIIRQKLELVTQDYLLAAAVIILILTGLVGYRYLRNYRRKQKMRVDKMLEEEKLAAAKAVKDAEESERRRIAADLHDNLGAYAASIAYNLEQVIQGAPQQSGAFEELKNNSQAMVSELSDTIWALKKDALRLTAISDRTKVFIQRLRNTYAHVNIEVEEYIEQDTLLPPSQAFHLLRIVQEAVNNALKHSNCRQVVVRVAGTDQWEISVTDDGCGLHDGYGAGEGNGLFNMKMRAQAAGWQISWISGEQQGTTVSVRGTTN